MHFVMWVWLCVRVGPDDNERALFKCAPDDNKRATLCRDRERGSANILMLTTLNLNFKCTHTQSNRLHNYLCLYVRACVCAYVCSSEFIAAVLVDDETLSLSSSPPLLSCALAVVAVGVFGGRACCLCAAVELLLLLLFDLPLQLIYLFDENAKNKCEMREKVKVAIKEESEKSSLARGNFFVFLHYKNKT